MLHPPVKDPATRRKDGDLHFHRYVKTLSLYFQFSLRFRHKNVGKDPVFTYLVLSQQTHLEYEQWFHTCKCWKATPTPHCWHEIKLSGDKKRFVEMSIWNAQTWAYPYFAETYNAVLFWRLGCLWALWLSTAHTHWSVSTFGVCMWRRNHTLVGMCRLRTTDFNNDYTLPPTANKCYLLKH